jgi:hypothetical protein
LPRATLPDPPQRMTPRSGARLWTIADRIINPQQRAN